MHEDSKITVDFNAFLEQAIEKIASINFNNIQVYGATQRMGIFRAFNIFSKLSSSSTKHQNSDCQDLWLGALEGPWIKPLVYSLRQMGA